jgi:hypothetical protein
MRSLLFFAIFALTACAAQPQPPSAASAGANIPGTGLALAAAPAVTATAPASEVAARALIAGETAAANHTPGTDEAPVADAKELEELDSGLVCGMEKRPGSRIREQVCYTREERVAYAEARDENVKAFIDELRREQDLWEAWQRQEAERQRSMMRRY